MNIALLDGQRQEAQPNLSGECPLCGGPTVAKCGDFRIWHWAHKGRRHCDPWKWHETDWHRNWKNQFPVDYREVVHHSEDGEKHIADVKTGNGWVIEFQHSFLPPGERRARDAFYPKLIWVVDGTRRKKDGAQLFNAWNQGLPVGKNSPVRSVFSDNCPLLREWAGSNAPIFFDLGDGQVLWWLFAKSTDGWAYVAPYSRAEFIESHHGAAAAKARAFDEFVTDIPKLIAAYKLIAAHESPSQTQSLRRDLLQPRRFRRHFRL